MIGGQIYILNVLNIGKFLSKCISLVKAMLKL